MMFVLPHSEITMKRNLPFFMDLIHLSEFLNIPFGDLVFISYFGTGSKQEEIDIIFFDQDNPDGNIIFDPWKNGKLPSHLAPLISYHLSSKMRLLHCLKMRLPFESEDESPLESPCIWLVVSRWVIEKGSGLTHAEPGETRDKSSLWQPMPWVGISQFCFI